MHTTALPALYLASLALARVILATAHGVPCDALEPARALLRASVRSHGVDAPAAVLAAMHSASMHLAASTLEHLGALAGDVTDCGNDATCAALALTLAADGLASATTPRSVRGRALALLRADAALRSALGCVRPSPAVVSEITRALAAAPVEAPTGIDCAGCEATGEGFHGARCTACRGTGEARDLEALAA